MTPVYSVSDAHGSEMAIVYRIRQVAYSASDVDIEDIPLRDEFDDLPNSVSHLLYRDAVPVGTVRTSIYSCHYDWCHIPAMAHHADDIATAFGAGVAIAQSSCFAITPEGRTRRWRPKALLFLSLVETAIRHNAEWIITIVRNRTTQLSFYERLGFQPMARPRIHPQVNRVGVLLRTTTQDYERWVRNHLES